MGTCGFMVYYTYKEYQSEQSYTYTFSSAAYVYKKVYILELGNARMYIIMRWNLFEVG